MTDVTFSRFDAAEYLETEEDIATFLDECAQDGNPEAIALALGAVARARNVSELARGIGMTRAGLYKALSPGGNPSLDTVTRVARAMGFRLGLVPIGAGGATDLSKGQTIEARATAEETVVGMNVWPAEEICITHEPVESVRRTVAPMEEQVSLHKERVQMEREPTQSRTLEPG